MKRVIAIIAILAIMIPTAAFATTPVIIGMGYYDDFSIVPFCFSDTKTTKSTNATAKGDNDQHWYITLLGDSNPSSTNILGARPRILNDKETAAGSYKLFKKKVSNNGHRYYSDTVTKGTAVFLRLKKDSDSTDREELYAAGRFCP